MLDKELKYFIDHQEDLVKKYDGQFIIIMDEAVVGSYFSLEDAYEAASQKFELGTFLIQECKAGESAYKQTFNSRVVFN